MIKRVISWVCVLFLLFISSVYAVIPMPGILGGNLYVDDTQILYLHEDYYKIQVLSLEQESLDPDAVDDDGLSSLNWYNIKVPLYEEIDQPGGLKPGDKAVIAVYRGGSRLLVDSPKGGVFTVPEQGVTVQIDLITISGPTDACVFETAILKALLYGDDGEIGLEEAIRALQIVSGL